MRKIIFYIIGFLLILWFIFIIIGLFSSKKENFSQLPTPNSQLQTNLILFYNKDLIQTPPASWQEFMDIKNGAIGTADNIKYAPEILVLLMLEQGVDWPDFDNNLGETALKFYTQFADPSKKVYTWNESRENSLIEFAQGKVSIIFAYEQDKDMFANINFGLARFPVIDISQLSPELPDLSESEKAVLAEMIEGVANGRNSVEDAISEGAGLIRELQK
ncbi:MAG: extracellular solute-binding protein [bacterium]